MLTRKVFVLGLVLFLSMVAGARAQVTITASGPVQGFALATLAGVNCANPPGFCKTLESLPIDLKADSYLTITFSARGVVAPSSTQTIIPQLSCAIDGKPCDPNIAQEFLYPTFCCDSRSFTWIASAAKGTHTVEITWNSSGTGTVMLTGRTLNVLAIAK
jgi:hypothetical protein